MIIALIGVLLFRNARSVITQYHINKSKAKMVVYLGPLLLLGYLLLQFSVRVFDFAQTSEELGMTEDVVPHYYQAPHHSTTNPKPAKS